MSTTGDREEDASTPCQWSTISILSGGVMTSMAQVHHFRPAQQILDTEMGGKQCNSLTPQFSNTRFPVFSRF